MLQTKADFRRKETQVETKDCVVDKVIRLSGYEFDRFSRNLLRNWDFIQDNCPERVVDSEGRYHCLLIVGDGRRDGILINAEGGNYARYSAFIPNVEGLLTVGQYPALAALSRKLTGIVDHITGQAEEHTVIDLLDLETRHGIDLMRNSALLTTVLGMLNDRPDIGDLEIDKNLLTLHRRTESMEQAVAHVVDDHVFGVLDLPAPEEKPSVLQQIRDAKQAPKPPRKEKSPDRQKGDAEL